MKNNQTSPSSAIDDYGEMVVENVESCAPLENEQKPSNYALTLMNFLNGFIGSGILTMPNAFKDAGLVLAAFLNPVVGLLSCVCIHMLVHINRRALQVQKISTPYTYAELGREAFNLGPKSLRKYSNVGKIIVTTAVISTSFGGCCVYFVFIGTNLESFFHDAFNYSVTKETCFLFILPIIILINSIQSIRLLGYFSMLSNCCQVIGITVIFFGLFTEEAQPDYTVGERFPRFLVSTLFIFEGISVAMGLFKAIDKPRNFYKPLGVLNVGILIITIFYWTIGFFGFRTYGSLTKDVIILNLPKKWYFTYIKLLYSTAVMLTYPLLMYVPLEEFLPHVKAYSNKILLSNGTPENCKGYRTKMFIIEMVFRAFLVVFTYALAAVVPNVDKMVGLAGAMTSSLSALIIPAALHLIVFWEHESNKGLIKIFHCLINGAIICLGIFGFVFGIYFSMKDILEFDPEADQVDVIEEALNMIVT